MQRRKKTIITLTCQSIITPIFLLLCNKCLNWRHNISCAPKKKRNWLFAICSNKFAYPPNFMLHNCKIVITVALLLFVDTHLKIRETAWERDFNGILIVRNFFCLPLQMSQILSFHFKKITSKITQM